MNNLSALIYLADVAHGVNVATVIFAILLVIGYGVATTVRLFYHVDNNTSHDKQYNPDDYEAAQTFFKNREWLPSRISVLVFAALVATAIMTPSAQTLYLIAGSEIGEQAVMNEEVRGIYEDVRAVLRSYVRDTE